MKYFSKDILRAEWISTYEREYEILWRQAVCLTTNVACLKHILPFRHSDLGLPHGPFWASTVRNYMESSILILSRLMADRGKRRLTLQTYRESVASNIVDPETRSEFDGCLAEIDFDGQMVETAATIRQMRNRWIVHLDRTYLATEPNQVEWHFPVGFKSIKSASGAVCELLDALSLGGGHGFYYPDYDPGVIRSTGTDSRPDVEAALDAWAGTSFLLRLPETEPDVWREYLKQLRPSQIETINHYRRKLGIGPPV